MQFLISRKPFKIGEKMFGANCIIAKSSETVIVCDSFPKSYSGKNPWLKIHVWDVQWEYWDCVIEQNWLTRTIWDAYCKNGKITPARIEAISVESLMHTDHHKKKSGSGRRINPYMEQNDVGRNVPQFSEITERAHWAHLDNYESGKASIVACSIK